MPLYTDILCIASFIAVAEIPTLELLVWEYVF